MTPMALTIHTHDRALDRQLDRAATTTPTTTGPLSHAP